MKENSIKEIEKSIKKTGFPLELKVGNIFKRNAWRIQHSEYYVDREEDIGREIDITAYKNIYKNELCVGLHIICEVKSNLNKPWVIFTTEKDKDEFSGWGRLHYAKDIESFVEGQVLDQESSLWKSSRVGRSYTEAFKKDTEPSQIFKALVSTVKAAEDALSDNEKAMLGFGINIKELSFLDPVVVIGGNLYEGILDNKEELVLNESQHIVVRFNYHSGKYTRSSYYIDIVTIKGLEELLNIKKAWLERVFDITLREITEKSVSKQGDTLNK